MAAEDSINLSDKERTILDANESVVYAKRCTRAVYGGIQVDAALVVLTNKRLIAAKDKMFSPPKVAFAAAWTDVSRGSGDQWNVDPTQIVLTIETTRGPLIVIDNPMVIYEIEIRGRALWSS